MTGTPARAPKHGRRGGKASAATQATLYYLDGVGTAPWTHVTLGEHYDVTTTTIKNGIAKLRKDGSAINWTTLNARFGKGGGT